MTPEDHGREQHLRRLGRVAAAPPADRTHVDEPLLALLRSGDPGDDLGDAVTHVARCADCRARLVEGDVPHRNVIVMAIEAPRSQHLKLARAAEASSARLVERGDGRWTAVVDVDNAEKLKSALVQNEPSVVSRLAVTSPVQVPDADEGERLSRGRLGSLPEVPKDLGIDAAEVHAWAQIRRAPRTRASGVSPGWLLFAALAIVLAIAIAYFLAVR